MDLVRIIESMAGAISFHFTGETTLNRQFQKLREASDRMEHSKEELERAIKEAKEDDAFRIFAEGARKSRF